MPKFLVVHGGTLAGLEQRVNAAIAEQGFEPVGGVGYSSHAACYVQGGLVPDPTNYPKMGTENTSIGYGSTTHTNTERVREVPKADLGMEKRERKGGGK